MRDEHTNKAPQKSPGNPGFFAFGTTSPVFALLFADCGGSITSHTTQHGGGDENDQKYSDWYDNSHQKSSSEFLPHRRIGKKSAPSLPNWSGPRKPRQGWKDRAFV